MQWVHEGEEDVSETKRMTQSQLDALYTTRRDAEVYDEAVRARAAESALAQRHAAARKLVHDAIVIATDDEVIRLLNEAYALLASEPTP